MKDKGIKNKEKLLEAIFDDRAISSNRIRQNDSREDDKAEPNIHNQSYGNIINRSQTNQIEVENVLHSQSTCHDSKYLNEKQEKPPQNRKPKKQTQKKKLTTSLNNQNRVRPKSSKGTHLSHNPSSNEQPGKHNVRNMPLGSKLNNILSIPQNNNKKHKETRNKVANPPFRPRTSVGKPDLKINQANIMEKIQYSPNGIALKAGILASQMNVAGADFMNFERRMSNSFNIESSIRQRVFKGQTNSSRNQPQIGHSSNMFAK